MPERGVLTVGLVLLHPPSGFLLTLLQEKGPSPLIQLVVTPPGWQRQR